MIAHEIIAEFGTNVKVEGRMTPDVSGALEVEIVGGPLLHSKLAGDGFGTCGARPRLYGRRIGVRVACAASADVLNGDVLTEPSPSGAPMAQSTRDLEFTRF